MYKKIKLFRVTTVPISLSTLLKGQHRYFSNCGFEVIGISSVGEELKDVNEQENIRVVPVEMTRTISPIKDLVSLWRFYNICRKEKPIIVHSHTPKAGIVGMLGAKLAGVPVRLHTVAGLPLMEATGIKRKVLGLVEKLTYASATKVYPNSNGLYDYILKHRFCNKVKLHVIGQGSSNGIDTNYFDPNKITTQQKNELRNDLGIDITDFIFIFIGRLVGDKGINELVEAFSTSKIKNSKLLLVGPLENELDPLNQRTLNEIENNPNIISLGFQKDVRPFFAISDCLVFPSYREGFPNVVMQAGAMALPSIVSNINGCNEIIIEGKNGTIIPVKDVKAIVQAMQKIYTDKEYYIQLQQNARSFIESRYEQSVIWNALLKEYNSLLEDYNNKKG